MGEGKQLSAGEKLIRILAFTLVLSVMNVSIFNIVLPDISEVFHLTTAQVSWVTSIYMLVYAIGSVIYGKLADKFQFKQLITFGLLMFAIGSLFGLTASSYGMVILGRTLQAVGSSVIPAAAMIIPIRYFPQESRGRALGISAIGMATGNALAPVVSGFILSFANWRWLFALSLLTLFLIPFYRKNLVDDTINSGRTDYLGGGLLAGSVGLLLLAVTNGGWMTLVGGLVFLVLFLIRILTTSDPFIQPKLFLNRSYTIGILISFSFGGIVFSLTFLLPQLLSRVHHLDPGIIGFILVPGAIASAVMGLRGGKLVDRRGSPFVFYMASGLLFICFALLSILAGSSTFMIALLLIFGNVGQTFLQIALYNTISRTLQKSNTGVGMGFMAMLNFLSFASSSAILSRILDRNAQVSWNLLGFNQDAGVYGYIFMTVAFLVAGLTVGYFVQFGRVKRKGVSLGI